MRNERGVTLIELVAVLAIVGIILVLISSVFIGGLKASNRSTTNQQLQQEANYITEAIRNEYLKNPEKDRVPIKMELEILGDRLEMDGAVISEGYIYNFGTDEATESILVLEIDRSKGSFEFNLGLEKNGQIYEVKTTFSKLK